jgi:hypothetical protein
MVTSNSNTCLQLNKLQMFSPKHWEKIHFLYFGTSLAFIHTLCQP